jgi:hypothetical protein
LRLALINKSPTPCTAPSPISIAPLPTSAATSAVLLIIDDKNANNLVDDPEDPIQKPISSSKAGWCLVGEFDNRRSCIQVNEYDKCMSGQIFPNREQCLKIR